MDAVLEDATIHERRQTLHQMTSGFGLDDAYSTTLDRIREQKGVKAKLGMKVLMWISRSKRPLKAEELCHALAVEVGTTDLDIDNVPSIRTLLSCTLGIVTIDEQTSTVRLVHFTLHEYLAAHPTLFITPHSMMAEICLTYLNFRSVCDISTLDYIPSTTPFLHYASCYWGFHARKDMTKGVKRLALRLLGRDANHISVDILLRELAFELPSVWVGHDNEHPDFRGFTGLHCIAYMGITEIAIDMVDMRRWDINGCDFNGATPLIWAAKYGNYTLAKLLLEQKNANPALTDKQGLAPLTHAAKAGHEDVVKVLLERGDVDPNLSDKDGRTPLSYAAGSRHERVVTILLERGDVDPNLSDKYGRTPLSYAAKYGHEDLVKVLLERVDVNPDSPDKDDRALLSYAAGSGYEGVVRTRLERIDVTQRISAPPASAQDEPESGLVLQREGITSNMGGEITEVIPLSPSEPLSNQLERPPSAFVFQPMPTSGTTPDPASLEPSKSLKRRSPRTQPSRSSKRKRLPPPQHPHRHVPPPSATTAESHEGWYSSWNLPPPSATTAESHESWYSSWNLPPPSATTAESYEGWYSSLGLPPPLSTIVESHESRYGASGTYLEPAQSLLSMPYTGSLAEFGLGLSETKATEPTKGREEGEFVTVQTCAGTRTR